ncbi:MAG TPA: pyridoxamine 5'-phosphate oxidase family protein [Myxococcota bacterium]|nr:pyridoxamine 5'-phosphate oxidase family protein [Myxococcota bacterium]
MSDLAVTPRSKLKRYPQRGSFDRAVVNAILDEGFVCHVSFLFQGQACLIPTVYARAGEWLILHGATANRALRALREPGNQACIAVTHIDSLVLARSAFHHSVNYRSVILYGQAEEVTDATEKMEALQALIEHVAAGRWKDVRQPNREEFLRTLVMRVPISEGAAKVRNHGVVDDAEDLELGCWAGLVPIEVRYGTPVRDPQLAAETLLPAYLDGYDRKPRASR